MSQATITGQFKGETITIIADSNYGGAITSLTWDGAQFVESPSGAEGDVGQQIQTAIHSYEYEGSWGGECYNPNEGGAHADTGDAPSTTQVTMTPDGNVLSNVANMAFWAPPGGTTLGCGTGAKNTSTISGVILNKTVTLGFDANIPQAIEYTIEFTLPSNYAYPEYNFIEAVAWYLPDPSSAGFSDFQQFNPVTGQITDVTENVIGLAPAALYQTLPIILTYGNNDYAAGIYSPQVQDLTTCYYDQCFINNGTSGLNKMGLAFYVSNLVPGQLYNYTFYLVIGSHSDVINGIASLAAVYPPPAPDISYSPNNYTFVENIQIPNPVLISNLGGPASFSISPTLPAGLALNTSTGEISGTPTALAAAKTYTVTAKGPNGTYTDTCEITIAVVTGVAFTIDNKSNNSIEYNFNGIDGTAATVTGSSAAQSGINPYFTVPQGTYTVVISPASTPVNCDMMFNTGQYANDVPGAEFTPIRVSASETYYLTLTTT